MDLAFQIGDLMFLCFPQTMGNDEILKAVIVPSLSLSVCDSFSLSLPVDNQVTLHFIMLTNFRISDSVTLFVCMFMSVCVCVCEFVITVNRGHTPKLHIQTEDNIANEDGPRFVDTCKRLQIAYFCIYRGMLEKKRK